MSAVAIVLSALLLISLTTIDCAKILAYYPTPSFSHQIVFRSLTNELVRRGHELTVITADPEYTEGNKPTNLTEVDVHDVSYGMWREHFLTKPAGKKDEHNDGIKTILTLMGTIIEKQLQSAEVKKAIDKNNKYDLLIVEAYSRPILALSHIFKVPVIQFSSFGLILDNFKHYGIPQHELLYPTVMRTKLHNLTVWEKIKELYNWLSILRFYENFEHEENALVKRVFGNDVPDISELAKNLDLILLNIHPMFQGIRPLPPNVIHIYGIHQKPKKELPNDLVKYLDSSKNGVIYISFGTNVKPSLLPPDRVQILVKVVSKLPYDVLWKWDEEKMTNRSSNIKIAKWLPQADLLRHSKIKLFITQGGLQSTDEAIEAGVPLLGIPMLGDQWFNVEQYVFLKIGLRLDIDTMTEEAFKKSVITLIEDTSYRNNIERVRSLMHDHPERPLERAVWWTEYVLRNCGAKHLRSPAANIHWIDFFEIKLILVLLSGLAISCVLATIAVRYLWKIVFRKNLKVKEN
nr:uridine diphosphate-glycosyltransferases 33AS1 [Glyphodes pyloalis]